MRSSSSSSNSSLEGPSLAWRAPHRLTASLIVQSHVLFAAAVCSTAAHHHHLNELLLLWVLLLLQAPQQPEGQRIQPCEQLLGWHPQGGDSCEGNNADSQPPLTYGIITKNCSRTPATANRQVSSRCSLLCAEYLVQILLVKADGTSVIGPAVFGPAVIGANTQADQSSFTGACQKYAPCCSTALHFSWTLAGTHKAQGRCSRSQVTVEDATCRQ